jgi:hypothetical protein
MKQPRRLVESHGPGAELLSAARAYRPPPETRRRVQRMLGLPVALSLGATVSAALASTSAKVLLAVVAVTATTGGLAAYRVTARHPAARAPASAKVNAPVAPATPAGPSLEKVPAGSSPGKAVPDLALTGPPRSRPVLPRPRRRVAIPARARPVVEIPSPPAEPPPAAPPPAAPPSLAAELALLDAAATDIRNRHFQEALDRLREHGRAFPASALAEEAAVLRIAALFGTNQRLAARAAAERFLLRSPGSLLADRVRTMLAADAKQVP